MLSSHRERLFAPLTTAPRRATATHAGRRCSPEFCRQILLFCNELQFQPHPLMILWQKQVTPRWLAANEHSLEMVAGGDLAGISRPRQARSLIQVSCRRRARAEKLMRLFGGVARPLPRNWARIAQSSQARAPIQVGRRLEILNKPPTFVKANGKLQLVIPAAGAFGTGDHTTTAMSLRLLEEATRNIPRGWRLLDVGTGTGILALVARRLGVDEVLGLDDDPRAVAHARQNARLNRISRATFLIADILRWKLTGRYDVITANLFSELLIAALPIFQRVLRPDGHLIISGILREQNASVVRALQRSGFRIETERRRGKWVASLWQCGIEVNDRLHPSRGDRIGAVTASLR